jgi:hypothetical protein
LAGLVAFVSHWLQTGCSDPNWCGGADFDKSSNVDLTDFAVLAQHWLEGT